MVWLQIRCICDDLIFVGAQIRRPAGIYSIRTLTQFNRILCVACRLQVIAVTSQFVDAVAQTFLQQTGIVTVGNHAKPAFLPIFREFHRVRHARRGLDQLGLTHSATADSYSAAQAR